MFNEIMCILIGINVGFYVGLYVNMESRVSRKDVKKHIETPKVYKPTSVKNVFYEEEKPFVVKDELDLIERKKLDLEEVR